jgi:uncharacterized membrane protein
MKKIIKKTVKAIIGCMCMGVIFYVIGFLGYGYINLLTSGGIYTFIAIAIIVLPLIGMFLLAYIIGKNVNKTLKPYDDYFDECKKKCERGEITKEEYYNTCDIVEAYPKLAD